MATAIEIGTLIDRDPNIRGGRPKIAGTGVTVMRIAGYYKCGLTPEGIEADMAEEAAAAEHLDKEFLPPRPR